MVKGVNSGTKFDEAGDSRGSGVDWIGGDTGDHNGDGDGD